MDVVDYVIECALWILQIQILIKSYRNHSPHPSQHPYIRSDFDTDILFSGAYAKRQRNLDYFLFICDRQ